MALMTETGWIGVDYSWARPNPAALAAQQVRFWCRYLSYDPTKNLSIPERDSLFDAGIGGVTNWENRAGDMLLGAAVGRTHGQAARALLEQLEQPLDVPCVASCDTGISWDQARGPVADYQAAFEQALAPWRAGGYGGLIFQTMLAETGLGAALRWQSYGWSTVTAQSETQLPALVERLWPGFPWETDPLDGLNRRAIVYHPETHVFQRLGFHALDPGPLGGPSAIDENVVRRPFPIWTRNGTTQEAPPTMSTYIVNGQPRTLNGREWPPGAIWYAIDDTGLIRNVRPAEAAGQSITPKGVGNAEIDDQIAWTRDEENRRASVIAAAVKAAGVGGGTIVTQPTGYQGTVTISSVPGTAQVTLNPTGRLASGLLSLPGAEHPDPIRHGTDRVDVGPGAEQGYQAAPFRTWPAPLAAPRPGSHLQ